jgi:GR25 family glycosyltransferase involved in LPS biosynthesis
MSGLNYFDGILYINLALREDRRVKIERELKKFSVKPGKFFRIEAFHDEFNGTRGCAYSHVQALNFAIEKGWKNVLILEDDCMFNANREGIDAYIQDFLNHFENNWDIFFLGANPRSSQMTDHSDYHRILFALDAHAYAVNGHYLPKLRDHFVSTFESMKEDLFFVSSLLKAIDRQWVDLQIADRWFIGKDPIAEQRDSYSDIEKKIKFHRHKIYPT